MKTQPDTVRRRAVVISGVGTAGVEGLGRPGPTKAMASLSPAYTPRVLPYREGIAPEIERYIPRPADQRAMGVHFQLGVCAAAQALEAAGVADELRKSTALFVATRVGERSEHLDERLFALSGEGAELEVAINQTLMTALRPTTFLAQIPNLLGGNIAIVLGVRGDSRTFIGEEIAGVNALHAAVRGIEVGRYDRVLVGGALNAKRESLLRWRHADPEDSGACLATASVFLLLEADSHAHARGISAPTHIETLGRYRSAGQDFEQLAADMLLSAGQTHADAAVVLNSRAAARMKGAQLGVGGENLLMSGEMVGDTLEVDAFLQVAIAMDSVRGGRRSSAVALTSGRAGDMGAFKIEVGR